MATLISLGSIPRSSAPRLLAIFQYLVGSAARLFIDGPLDVKRVEEVNLPYAGYAIVFCGYGEKEVGFYINGVRKVK